MSAFEPEIELSMMLETRRAERKARHAARAAGIEHARGFLSQQVRPALESLLRYIQGSDHSAIVYPQVQERQRRGDPSPDRVRTLSNNGGYAVGVIVNTEGEAPFWYAVRCQVDRYGTVRVFRGYGPLTQGRQPDWDAATDDYPPATDAERELESITADEIKRDYISALGTYLGDLEKPPGLSGRLMA